MKHAEWIVRTLIGAGTVLPAATVASAPCPPPTVSIEGGSTVTTACTTTSGSGSYSTEFSLTENPISEGGKWTNTISKTFNAPVSTQGGHAFGLTSTGYNDSIAMLTGTYGRDQTITATAYRGSGASGPAEIELHLRMSMNAATQEIYSYEVDFLPSLAAVALVKWHGTQGTFTKIAEAPLDGVADGDVFTASAIGPAQNTVFTITKNGKTLLTYTDTAAFATGNPGIGFDAGSPSYGANLGWTNYKVTTTN
jgi:hypothetical protein